MKEIDPVPSWSLHPDGKGQENEYKSVMSVSDGDYRKRKTGMILASVHTQPLSHG